MKSRDSTGPSGVYLAGLFDRMGVGPEVKAKTKTVASGLTVGSIVVTVFLVLYQRRVIRATRSVAMMA